MNDVKLLGRVAQDIELRTTPGGKPVTSFDIAVPVPSKDKDIPPDYFTIVCWDWLANFASIYLAKGRQIAVSGRLTTRKFTDKDGKNRKIIEIKANEIYFADSNTASNGNQTNGTNQSEPVEPATPPTFEELSNSDDLPF